MGLLEFHPTDGPPQLLPDGDWPSEEERERRLGHLRWSHTKVLGNGSKRVIDAVPPLFLRPIVYSRLPNLAAVKAVLEFHNIGPGDGTEEQTAAFLKSQVRGLVAFGPPRTVKTWAVFARLSQLYVWDAETFCWVRAYDLATLALDRERDGECKRIFARLAEFQENVFIDDLDLAKFQSKYAEALYRLIDYRVSQELPTVVTTQTTGDEFVDRVAGRTRHLRNLAQGIAGRLRQSCDCVDFGYGISTAFETNE